jgi:hypothetical protein
MTRAHRKLRDLHAVRPSSITTEALERIGALYRIEEHIVASCLRNHGFRQGATEIAWNACTELLLCSIVDTAHTIEIASGRGGPKSGT